MLYEPMGSMTFLCASKHLSRLQALAAKSPPGQWWICANRFQAWLGCSLWQISSFQTNIQKNYEKMVQKIIRPEKTYEKNETESIQKEERI